MFKQYRQRKALFFVVFVLIGMLFIMSVVMTAILSTVNNFGDNVKLAYDYGWISTEGDFDTGIDNIRGDAVFLNVITQDQAKGRSLCFYSKNVYFNVYVDGRMVYSFHPHEADIYGQYYGSMPHQVELGSVGPSSTVVLEATSIGNSKGSFSGIALESGTEFVKDVFRASLFPYCISIVISFMGFMLVLGGLSIMTESSTGKEIAAMGLFALDAGVWTACSTDVAGVVIGTPVTIHFVNYITLIVLPVFAVVFVFRLTGRRYKFFANAIVCAAAVTLFLDVILTATGVSTYHDLLFLTHIECVATVIYSFICVVTSARGKMREHNTRVTVTLAFLSVTLGGFVDLVRYIVGWSGFDSAYFFRLGMMLFVFILGVHEIYALMFYRKYETEAEEMSKLAFTDALTGMQNRMAFTSHEDTVMTRSNGECIVIQFDINNLKKVNDNYGHKEGDRHIKAAADIIAGSFGNVGNCYRTGGDEFIVVVEDLKDKEDLDLAKEKFNRLIEEYNREQKPRVKLEIAYGIQEFDLSSSDVEGALRLADGKMYSMKKQMKGQN